MARTKNKPTDEMNPNKTNDSVDKLQSAPRLLPVPSNDVFTSYIFSTSNRSLSKYGERLLMEVISVAQEYTVDAALGIHKLNFAEKYKEKFAIIDIPVRNLLNADDTTNYTKAKEAAVELMKIYHTVEAPVLDETGNQKTYKDGSPQYQFASFHLLDKVVVNQKPGIVSVKLGEETWSQILDMGKGYARYNLLTAKSLDDVVAIRLFQMMSNTSEPLHFSLERIKGILGMQDKYVSNPTGFIRRVIEPAEQEIREKCPFEVVHELEYEQVSKKGRPAIKGLVFSKVMKASIIKDPALVLDAELIKLLKETFKFDDRGIMSRSNLKLFQDLKEAGHDIKSFLTSIKKQCSKATKPQAYAIRSLQNLLANEKPVSRPRAVDIITQAKESAPATKAAAVRTESPRKKSSRLIVNEADAFKDSGLEEL